MVGLGLLAACQNSAGTDTVATTGATPLPTTGPSGKPLYYFMVYSNPTDGKEDEYNRWYDRIHAPVVIEGGDFVWAQRFELAPEDESFAGPGTPELKTRKYMVIFAAESDNIKETLRDANERLAMTRNTRSDSLDYSTLQAVSWKALGPPTTQAQAKKWLAEEEAAGNIPAAGTKREMGEMPQGMPPGPPPSK